MKKILIIGISGAGKSTLALRLGSLLNIEVIHLDKHFWKPGWVESDPQEWRKTVEELCHKDQWIMEGNYAGTFDMRMSAADMIICLDFPRLPCLWHVIRRRFQYRNMSRPDLPEGCPERFDFEFYKWIWNFPKNDLPKTKNAFEKFGKDKKIVILHSFSEMDMFCKKISETSNF